MENKSASEWEVTEVCDWLQQLDLDQYCEKFEQMRIDGMLLFAMTDEDLREDLGVGIRLHRFKILESVRKLKEEKPVESAPEPWDMLALKAIEGQLTNNIFIIGSSGTTIGRHSSSNDIVISESFVSRKHCKIQFDSDSGQFVLFDLGSTTGTFVMIRQPLVLKKGTLFQMGLSEFIVENIKQDEMELAVYEGPAKHSSVHVNRQGLTIGRDSANSFCVREDSQMSNFHAQILYTEQGFELSDKGSTNKTWLRLSEEAEKSHGNKIVVDDVIKIGSTVFVAQVPEQGTTLPGVGDDHSCKICYARESDTACYPCGHVWCYQCATKCSQCPNCRRDIDELVKLYK